MADIDPAIVEASFAIAQIEAPHPAKALIESQRFDLCPLLFEILGPKTQSFGVVASKIFGFVDAQTGRDDLLAQGQFAGQHAAREYIALDKIGALAIPRKEVVLDCDDLEGGA